MKRTLSVSLLALGLAGCASTPPPYLAKVNDEPVTAEELKNQFVKRHGGHEKFLAGMVEVKKFVDIVVDWKLLIQESYRLGLHDTPAIKADVDAYRERKMLEYLLKTEIEQKAIPSSDEIKEAWEKNTSEVVTTRQIVVETKDEAEAIRRGLAGGTPFEEAARECSIVPSNVHDGLLPEIGWGSLDAAWEAAVFPLKPGELSPVFKGKDGWEVDRLEMRSPVEKPELGKARNRIEGILKRRKTEQRRRELSEVLNAKYHVVFAVEDRRPASLGRLLAESPDATVVSWDGGKLSVKELFNKDEIAALRGFAPWRAQAHTDELIQRSLNESLAKLEARARKLDEVPEVADDVKRRQEDLMEGALYADHILKDIAVTDADVKAYYEKHKAELVTPERRRVAHIVLESEAEAKEVRGKLEAGDPFAELVKAKSKDAATVKQAGDLGFITKKEVPPEFAAVLELKQGEISQPVKSKFGWHLIKVTAIEPPRPMPFEEAKSDVEKRVREDKKREKRAYWVAKLRESATIKVSEAGVKKFLEDNSVK